MRVTLTDEKGLCGAAGGIWELPPTQETADALKVAADYAARHIEGNDDGDHVVNLLREIHDCLVLERGRIAAGLVEQGGDGDQGVDDSSNGPVIVSVRGGMVTSVTGGSPHLRIEVRDYDVPRVDDGDYEVDDDGNEYALAL